MKSFNQLTQSFGLNKTQFWRYLQLRHLLSGTFGSSSQGPPEDNILSIILEAWGRGHEASVYYRLIMEKVGYSFHSATKRVWSKDLNISISDEDWTKICRNCRVMSRNLGVRLIQFKILNHFYWTPRRLFRLSLKDSAECW